MEKRADAGVEYKHNGCNCCQAVLMAYSDILDTNKEVLMNLGSGFGLGMGCMEGTCGALSGAVMLAGLKGSCADLETPKSKGATYKVAARIVRDFKEKAGATACKDLKGVETGKMLYSCPDCIKTAAALAEEILFTEEK